LANIEFSIYRFDPEKDKKPRMQNFTLELPEEKHTSGEHVEKDMMLLEALIRIKDEQDPSLTFRRSCGEGVCGSDGMNINGTNGLACITPVRSLKQPIVIRPLPAFPVIKDLVVDMTQFFNQYEQVKPYLQSDENAPPTERLQSPEERAKLDGLYECILCACCTSSCPSYWWNPDKFLGPAALLAADRFIQDSRDTQTDERLAELEDPFSLYRCRGIMNCTNVCPKGLNPTAAIGDIRGLMLKRET
jgi:succinate dehydrogenase / fumarate reductase iron-sulfur subunit